MQIDFNTPTPIEYLCFNGVEFTLKRDDLINSELSGNKARKIDYYLYNLPKNITTVVSYGSIQSNAMFSISYFAKVNNLKFIYYANHIPSLLKENPRGNLELALKNGMILKEGYSRIEEPSNSIFIKEGIAEKSAYIGIEKLAKELIEQLNDKESYQIFLPSGTGTTSLFLSKAIKKLNVDNLEVYTTPCVGERGYLIEQFASLERNSIYYPTIIDSKKRYHFGKLYREFYQIWLELQKNTSVEFDLLYDPKGWITLFDNLDIFTNLVYIHQGGRIGNISMLERYRRKYGELNEDS